MDIIRMVLNKEFSHLREEIVDMDYFKFKKYVHWVDEYGSPIISYMYDVFFIDGGIYVFLKSLLGIDDNTLSHYVSEWLSQNFNLPHKKVMPLYDII
jgi:hypothetical protein